MTLRDVDSLSGRASSCCDAAPQDSRGEPASVQGWITGGAGTGPSRSAGSPRARDRSCRDERRGSWPGTGWRRVAGERAAPPSPA